MQTILPTAADNIGNRIVDSIAVSAALPGSRMAEEIRGGCQRRVYSYLSRAAARIGEAVGSQEAAKERKIFQKRRKKMQCGKCYKVSCTGV